MSDLIKLTSDGVKLYSWSGINRKYTENKPKIWTIWSELRNSCEIASDFTFGKLIEIIKSDPEFDCFVSIMTGSSDFDVVMLTEDYDKDGPDLDAVDILSIERNICVNEKNISIEPTFDITKVSLDSKLVLNKHSSLFQDGKKICEGYFGYSLYDICKTLFHKFLRHEPSFLTKNGLCDVFGNEVDNPIGCLFQPCSIGENVTLEDVFKVVEKDDLMKEFITHFSGIDINNFHLNAFKANAVPNPDLLFAKIYTNPKVTDNKNLGLFIDIPLGGSHMISL